MDFAELDSVDPLLINDGTNTPEAANVLPILFRSDSLGGLGSF